MPRQFNPSRYAAIFLALATALVARAAPPATPPAAPAATAAAATQPQAATTQPAQTFPHIQINTKNKTIDIDARVVTRKSDWLELLACTPNSREYESVLTVDARPSHIHLALLMLGLEPGSPLTWKPDGDKAKPIPPRGPRVAVTLLVQKNGKQVEVQPGEWVINQKTGQPLSDNVWLFTGSKFVELGGRQAYLADLNGNAISLVNFGDDVLTRSGTMINFNSDATWGAKTENIPEIGTAVVIRLHVLDEAVKKGTEGHKE